MDHLSRNIPGEPRNTPQPRPDAGLRWAGRVLFLTTIYLITDLALQPGLATPPVLLGPDKLEHIAAFLVLTLLARMAWPQRVWITPLALLSYGVWIEWAQAAQGAGRTASGADIIADLIGIALGVLLANLVTRQSRT
tara:strand:+ start:23061 stop:23471 length:411 start_codon:yes stop_codon:yes gene_type:complete